jgi:hypothetical protein
VVCCLLISEISTHLKLPRYATLAKTLIDEVGHEIFRVGLLLIFGYQFPVRPHWTKNTRDVFKQSVKNLNQDVCNFL